MAMLGKYYSIFLIVSFGAAAVSHPLRRAYFSSWSPWVSIVTGLAALLPHMNWLATTGAAPFSHALTHAGVDLPSSLREAASFLAGLAATMSVAISAWVMIAGYRLRCLPQDVSAMSPSLRMICHIAIGTIALPVLTAMVVGTDLPSLWALQGLFLFVVPIVCSTSYRIERFYTVNATILVAGIALAALVFAAPIHALYRNSHGYKEGRIFYRQAADELTGQWRKLTGTPLPIVDGDDSLAFATAFYSPDHPDYAPTLAYQAGRENLKDRTINDGWAALCFHDQPSCLDWMERATGRTEHFVRRELSVRSKLFGVPGSERTVDILMVLPRAAQTTSPATIEPTPRERD
jgi:hypothetical protein